MEKTTYAKAKGKNQNIQSNGNYKFTSDSSLLKVSRSLLEYYWFNLLRHKRGIFKFKMHL